MRLAPDRSAPDQVGVAEVAVGQVGAGAGPRARRRRGGARVLGGRVCAGFAREHPVARPAHTATTTAATRTGLADRASLRMGRAFHAERVIDTVRYLQAGGASLQANGSATSRRAGPLPPGGTDHSVSEGRAGPIVGRAPRWRRHDPGSAVGRAWSDDGRRSGRGSSPGPSSAHRRATLVPPPWPDSAETIREESVGAGLYLPGTGITALRDGSCLGRAPVLGGGCRGVRDRRA